MLAVKANKVYTIDESQKKHYQQAGFDIKNNDGTIIEYGRGKTVAYEKYKKLQGENEKLREELETLKASIAGDNPKKDAFSDMSIDELKAYAEANSIDIGGATTQNGIIKKIREAEKEAE